MKKLIIIGVVVIVLALGGFGVYTAVSKPAANTVATEATENAIITYSDDGYNPKSITVKTGNTVTIRNTSSRSMQFDSDPHPSHTTNRELNVDSVAPGQSETFTVTKTGTFGYHNHLDESETGMIIVQ